MTERHQTPAERLTLIVRLIASGFLITLTSLAILPLAALTLFRARRVYAAISTWVARAVLRICGLGLRVHQDLPFPKTQVVYVSNHSSTIDLFVLIALGLPNTRFFLWRGVQRFVPLAIFARLMGTFFTVTQDRTAERRRIFADGARTLRQTRESVYLSPEGCRVTTGDIGPFNKGAFHMAIDLGAPIVPLYFHIPKRIDPGAGFRSRPGIVDVYVMPAIDTREWALDNLVAHKDAVRDRFVEWHRAAHEAPQASTTGPVAAQVAAALAR